MLQLFKKKLIKRSESPHNQASQLRDFQNTYKIKLRSAGYYLVYEVNEGEILIYKKVDGVVSKERA